MPEPTRDPAPRFVAATTAAVDPRSANPPAEPETLEAELRRVREENERLRLELEDLRQQLEQLRQEASLGEFRSFTEELIRQGRALPAEREELEDEFRDLMRAQQALTFSEREVDLIGRQRRRLERRPVLYSSPGRHFATAERAAAPAIDVPDRFRAVAGRVDPESAELDRRLRSYVQRHGCSYEDAYSALAAQRG